MSVQITSRLTLFSSYFEDTRIPEYVKKYLDFLRPHSSTLVYLTTDDKIFTEEDALWLETHTDGTMQVKNEGFDFGMWQKALQQYDVSNYEELCLVNDSCVCISNLDAYFHWHGSVDADMTGMTSSNQIGFHLQSFFLTIKNPAVGEASQYINNLKIKEAAIDEVISSGEVGLSRYLMNNGFMLKGWYESPIDDMGNPTFNHAVELLDFGVPLVKKKLFVRYNSAMLKNQLSTIGNWRFSDFIQHAGLRANLDERSINEFFAWYQPRSTTIRDKFRITRWLIKYKLGLLNK